MLIHGKDLMRQEDEGLDTAIAELPDAPEAFSEELKVLRTQHLF